MENIDDEADQLEIGFVKIHDEELADEYNLGVLPKLVYYRHQIPIIYEGKWMVVVVVEEDSRRTVSVVIRRIKMNYYFNDYCLSSSEQANCPARRMCSSG